MCCPFHERKGDWWRYENTWVKVFHFQKTIEDSGVFVSNANSTLADRRLEATFSSGKYVSGEEHILACSLHALRSRERGSCVTRSVGMETLLYVAGTRNVQRALASAGLKEGDDFWAIIFCPDGVDLPADAFVTHALDVKSLKKEWRTEETSRALERAALTEALCD